MTMQAPSPPWAYLFVFSPELGTTEDVHAFVDKHPNILHWYRCLPNSYFLVSDLSAKGLSAEVRAALGVGRFVILDTATDRDGWLPREVWSFLQKPGRFAP